MSNLRAFPSAAIDDKFGGMTLRDYFAGQCILASPGDDYSPAEFARAAYALADAMLAERERT
jgi:hypothetical protein